MNRKENTKYLLLLVIIIAVGFLSGCSTANADGTYNAIEGFTSAIDILVWPMAGLMWALGKSIAFANYGVVIILATIIVRTCAWPIYAKSNDMSLKMGLMGPEQAKIQKKYEGKDDPESKQRMQTEMMQLYKKYGVGIGGCIMPFIQFPIFIAFFTTLQRIPMTLDPTKSFNFKFLNSNFLGVNLFLPMGDSLTKIFEDPTLVALYGLDPANFEAISRAQTIGVIVLAVLVGLTQIGIQLLTEFRQKKMKQEAYSDVPAYRRQQPNPQQKSTEITMKVVMYGMSIMMVFFVLRSTAALGLYWLIGNIYSGLQSYLGKKMSNKRMEKLKQKM